MNVSEITYATPLAHEHQTLGADQHRGESSEGPRHGHSDQVHAFDTESGVQAHVSRTWREYAHATASTVYESLPSLRQIRAQVTPKRAMAGLVGLLLLGQNTRLAVQNIGLATRMDGLTHDMSCMNYRANDWDQLRTLGNAERLIRAKGGQNCDPSARLDAIAANAAWTEMHADALAFEKNQCRGIASKPYEGNNARSLLWGAKADPKSDLDKMRFNNAVNRLSYQQQLVETLHDAAEPGSEVKSFRQEQLAALASDFHQLRTVPKDVPCPRTPDA